MNIIDVTLIAIALGLFFWIVITAWEEWRQKALSELTIVAVLASTFFLWIVGLSAFNAL